jgi:hypothetical protein
MSLFSMDRLNALAIKKQCLDGTCVSVADVVERTGGLHATSPTTPYLSLFARLKNFNIKDLDEELYVKRTMGRIRSVRGTVYIFPVEFMPVAFAATRRVIGLNSLNHCKYMGVTERDYEELSKGRADDGVTGEKGPPHQLARLVRPERNVRRWAAGPGKTRRLAEQPAYVLSV